MFICNDIYTNIYIVLRLNYKLKVQFQVGGLDFDYFTKSKEDKKMTENIENNCQGPVDLESENRNLKRDIRVLEEELSYFKKYAVELESELNHVQMMFRSLKYHDRILTIERNNLQKTVDELKTASYQYDSFLAAELLAEEHEDELVAAMGSFLGDDY